MKPYFYKTTNKINGKYYYGSGSQEDYLGSGKAFKDALKKYGEDSFDKVILREFDSREEAFEFEDRFLKIYKPSKDKMSYNMKDSAVGGDTLSNHPEIDKIKEKISLAGKNRVFTEEHRKNLSLKAKERKGNKPCPHKGKKYEDYMSKEDAYTAKEKLRQAQLGTSLSDETKQKISKAQKGIPKGPFDREHKLNIAKAKGTSIEIDGIVYYSMNEACRKLKTTKYMLHKMIKEGKATWT